MTTEPLTEDVRVPPDAILEWSKVSSEIELEKRKAKERVLTRHGISQGALDELKILVMDELSKKEGKVIENEYGQIRGKWSFLKDRDGNSQELGCVHCYIIPKEKK